MHKPQGQKDFLPFLMLMMMGNRSFGNDMMPLIFMLMMMQQPHHHQPHHPHPMPMPHPPHGHSAHSLEG
ncbi:MAG: hypothetical protein FWB98_01205 [Defluviitaleaceae bacterium]|nr:hypothetical protein [Defluviitaleaceae bacterium]